MVISRQLILVCLFYLINLLTLGISCQAQTIYIPHYTVKNGLVSNNCYDILQDRKGFIWISTEAGVSRFDGSSFQNFSIEDGLPETEIIKIKEDSKGRIWFITLTGQLSYYYDGKIYNHDNQKFLKALNLNCVIMSVFEDKKGHLWFGSNHNFIALWDGITIKKFTPKNPKSTELSNAFIYQDDTGKIWAYSKGGTYSFNGNGFNKLNYNILNRISNKIGYNDKNHLMYFIDKTGLKSNQNNAIKQLIKIDTALLNNNPPYFYYNRNKNELWLGSNNNIFNIDSNGKSKKIISNVSATQIIKDNKDNIWFTTNNGIYMLPNDNECLYILNKDCGLSDNVVKSITKDNNNRLWLGLNNASINVVNEQNLVVNKITFKDQKKFKNIKQLQLNSNNRIFFESDYGFGVLSKINNQKPDINLFKTPNNATYAFKHFALSKNNGIALALSSGVKFLSDRLNLLEFNPFNKNTFLGRAYHVFYDNKDNLWFSNVNGLFEIANGKLINHSKKNTLLTKRINDIEQLSDGTLVLATDGYGILLYKPNKLLKQITKNNGLANNICSKIFINDNQIWVVTNKGINKLKYKNNKVKIFNFDLSKELFLNGVNDIFIDNKNAYFATNDGLLFTNKNYEDFDNESPKIYITSIFDKNQLPIDSKPLKLANKNNSLSINYSAINFKNEDILYRYRLNSNSNWVETKAKHLEFSSLEPGDYTFEICAKTQNTDWSKPAKVSFIIQEQFWQTIWFFCIIILFTAYIINKVANNITRKQKDKEQQQLLLKNKILLLEQQALQAMMNPHFIFNVMNAIQHFINTQNTASANKILTGFAKLIRKNLEICTKSYISLDEELEYLKLYLNLEKSRFGDKLKYALHIDENIDKEETLIPSMLLQPYIENAIWHGIMPIDEGGIIQIDIKPKENNYLSIEITDNGVGINNSLKTKKGDHISKGMALTKERLNLLSKIASKSIELNIFQNGLHGTTVQISIPMS